ncbi:glycosyltransferase [Deinococcus pimensis]|uniref:glycosyltransferase n=1 Tax=Deinococcus pimensis TaxID=309888 RepID=UPI00047F118F|nr:glycosyltransferase [Deinococcus pimensis]
MSTLPDHARSPSTTTRPTVMLVEPDDTRAGQLTIDLIGAGYEVAAASTGPQALALLGEFQPDVLITASSSEQIDSVDFIRRIRAEPTLEDLPIIVLTHKERVEDVVEVLEAGADDFVSRPVDVRELRARIHAKLTRPPTPLARRSTNRRTGLLTETTFDGPLSRELDRAAITTHPLCLASIQIEELTALRDVYGAQLDVSLFRQLRQLIVSADRPLDVLARGEDSTLSLLMPETTPETALAYARALSARIVGHDFTFHGDHLRLTPSIGVTQYRRGLAASSLRAQARTALTFAASHLDLIPVMYDPAVHGRVRSPREKFAARLRETLRLPVQALLVGVILIALPFFLYTALALAGIDITPAMYVLVVVALVATAALIILEGLLALNPTQPPPEIGAPYPRASAIIAAYLPNEAATVLETVEAFLRVDYPAGLQVILAYNTPRDLPVEEALRDLARRDARFVPFRVEGSTSKAQNVNAALSLVTGEFTGVYDADHHPDPDGFRRAWRWLSNGWDVVQGHCFIRNGEESWIARLVAVEFESIYAVSHPGRARMHDFGIFGGSNGFWRTEVLRRIRMRGSMLTEDIDSALRAVEGGLRIGSDPYLVSRELAPTTLRALTNQRLRWAQGWFQVSLRHLLVALSSRKLTLRQKFGFVHLLAWRELYPILSLQMFPIVLFWLYGPTPRSVNWFVPIFVLTSLFTLSVGPWQTLFAYLRAEPDLRRRPGWFVSYLVLSSVFYTPYKNLLAVVAQLKEVRRERAWKVTPRSSNQKRE